MHLKSKCLFYYIFSLSHRSTRDSSCFTVVLNNLRVFLIFDWLQLVRDFLHMPAEKGAAPTHQRWPSGSSDQGGTGAVMPKTVKSGVVTKRSTVPVTQDKYLEVKINVTGNIFTILCIVKSWHFWTHKSYSCDCINFIELDQGFSWLDQKFQKLYKISKAI